MNTSSSPPDPATMTALLRSAALAIRAQDIGFSTDTPVWGLMMELGGPEVTVSLVALLDGSVSIYLSDGDGVIGCGLHRDVNLAAVRMVSVAQRLKGACQPSATQPMPSEQQVSFYLLTPQGVLGALVRMADLDEGAVELAELYYAGHAVISLVELLGAGTDLVDEIHLAENARRRRLRLAGNAAAQTEVEQSGPKSRGRACRILPYVGNVARRSQH